MVNPDPVARPTASKLTHTYRLRNAGTHTTGLQKTKSQLFNELKKTKARLRMLEFQLSLTSTPSSSSAVKANESGDTANEPQSQPAAMPSASEQEEGPRAALNNRRLLIGRGCPKSRSANSVITTALASPALARTRNASPRLASTPLAAASGTANATTSWL